MSCNICWCLPCMCPLRNDFVGPGYIPPFKPNNKGRENNKEANEVNRGANKMSDTKSLSHRINNLACDLTHEIQAVRMSDSEMIRYIQDKLTSFMLTYQENLLKKDS